MSLHFVPSWRSVLCLAALTAGPGCGGGGEGSASASGASDTGTTSAGTDTSASDPTSTTPGTSESTDGTDTTTSEVTSSPTTSSTTAPDPTTGDPTTGDTMTGDTTSDTTTTGDTTGDTTGIGGEPNVLYVRDDGQDGNPGTIEQPLRTIQWAIGKAEQAGNIDTIRVAEGNYTVDYANDDIIVMVPGVSLHGGYRADWGARDPAQYVTHVVDATPVAIQSSEDDPHRAIEIPAGVAGDTVLEGFHVSVARGQFRAAVFVQGDPTIRDNVIEPVVDDDSVSAYGLRVHEGHPSVVANRIRFDLVDDSGQRTGVSASLSDGLFADNVIDMSAVSGGVYGIRLSSGAAKILGNSIYLQEGVNSYGIYLVAKATPTIDNNLIESADFSATCIYSMNAETVPSATRNNVLSCNYTLFGSDPLRTWTTVMNLEDGLMNASDNLKLPQHVIQPDNDLALDAQDPCTVTQGGRDITADVPVDIAGQPRTLPLSIGAHEWDAGCQ